MKAGPPQPLTLVYVISRLGVGDGQRYRCVMRTVALASTLPYFSNIAESPGGGLGALCPAARAQWAVPQVCAHLYIGKYQTGVL